MKISTVIESGEPKVCFLIEGEYYDLSTLIKLKSTGVECTFDGSVQYKNIFRWADYEYWICKMFDFARDKISSGKTEEISKAIISKDNMRFLPPVPACPNMFGIIHNSPQFWRKKSWNIPNFAAGYIRPPGSLIGHEEIVTLPPYCGSFRCAAEFGVVIGKEGSNIREEEAMDYIFGYTCVNDMISNYWKRFAEEQNPKNNPAFYEYLVTSYYGRGTRNFGPVGPHIVSKDEIPDPYNLVLFTKRNGEVEDRAFNNSMILGIERIISQLSSFMTLKSGTIIHTGTMGADGITIDADTPLTSEDYVEIEIEKVGKLRNYFKDLRFDESLG